MALTLTPVTTFDDTNESTSWTVWTAIHYEKDSPDSLTRLVHPDTTVLQDDTMDDSDGDGDSTNDNDYPFFTKDDCEWADDGSDPAGFYNSIGSFSGDREDYVVDGSDSFYTVPFFKTIGGVEDGAMQRAYSQSSEELVSLGAGSYAPSFSVAS